MEAVVFPYLPVQTDYIDIYNKKEAIKDFYLIMDLRPLFDCVRKEVMYDRMQDELNNLK
ncbi:hypothetical protein [Flavobacterium sp. FlaQc-50]|jgi:glutaredoxin-related protein|uniref:hypothetical protein n=1 Tax=unclassified Flavobacterium TaxID=196869 RepID=UPI00375772AF